MTTLFHFEALTSGGELRCGEVAAMDYQTAAKWLREQNLFPVFLRVDQARVLARISQRDLALGLKMLADLITCGLNVNRAIGVFEGVAPRSWRSVLLVLQQQIRDGSSLGVALRCVSLPPEVAAIIAAGERGDGLGAGLRRAAEIVEESAKARADLLAALSYPILLGVVGGATSLLLVNVVLPKFAAMISDLGQRLPPTTAILIGVAATAQRLLPAAVLGLLVAAMAWLRWTGDESGRQTWHELLLRVPAIGTIRRAHAVARTCSAAAAMLHTGVALPVALQYASAASGDSAISARVRDARSRIIGGARVSRALQDTGSVTETAIQLTRVGEETGRLAEMLDEIGRIEQRQAIDATRALVRLIEPTLILAFGALVAFVAAALLQAVYSIRPA